jgi:F-type H+-transporting ATPase subunit alpha
LKQDQYKPLTMEKQVVLVFAATNGYLDPYPVADGRRYEQELYSFLPARHPTLLQEIADKKDIKGELTDKLKAALAEFAGIFQPSAKG